MISFASDYVEGCHPRILDALVKTNLEQSLGYGCDEYSEEARELIRERIACPEAEVHFLVGGTQTNLLIIAASLRPHEGVISASSGHINVHETGAIEACGHKVLAQEVVDGKLTAKQIEEVLQAHKDDPTAEHMVKPGMIYISNTTETGTIYKKAELEAISEVAKRWDIPLYLDGARLGSALMVEGQDLKLEDLAELCDAFSIGGTKNGLLFGEALIIVNPRLQKDFRYIQKQKGGMLAKGRLLGIQFKELFRDNLFFEMAAHENEMANALVEGLQTLKVQFAATPVSNQLFFCIPEKISQELEKEFIYEVQEKRGEDLVIRLCTSFATPKLHVDRFLESLERLLVAVNR